jgi:hypothetical protein
MALFLILFWCRAAINDILGDNSRNSRFGGFNSRLGRVNSRLGLLWDLAGKPLI